MATLRIPAMSLKWLLLFLFITFVSPTTSMKLETQKLGVHRGTNVERNSQTLASSDIKDPDLKTFYYNQTLDHFNYNPESYTTFKQRYVINFKHWGGSHRSAPILAYLGEEANLDFDLDGSIGCLSENAPRFKALQVYMEHRYYGESIPYGMKREDIMKNATARGYFNSAQALADYAELLLHIKKNLSSPRSPIIVMGGSYGGMLAAWFRLKYPHVAMGALASSAPILYFDLITKPSAYYDRVTKDFRDASESCYQTIKQSWGEIEKAGATKDGLAFLSKKFNTCKPLNASTDLTDYLESLYSVSAQYDSPPNYPVNSLCKAIDEGAQGTDILGRIFSGIVSTQENKSCNDIGDFFSSETLTGWDWQTCSDIVMPMGIDNETMFPPSPYNETDYNEYCKETFGVAPRPHWITTYYGGFDIEFILKRFGSNIIFSNGLRDPYSSAGVVKNISDTLVAVTTEEGSHCLDILTSRKDDPKWLVKQRIEEVEIMGNWLQTYYADLVQSN